MTTDLTTLKKQELAAVPMGVRDFNTIENKRLNTYKAGFSSLENMLHDFSEDPDNSQGWEHCMNATFDLLQKAQNMLEKAETTISEQDKRIKALEELSSCDEITGLRNRRGFFDAFISEIDRCERGISKGGLLLIIDLDNFDSINTQHGHVAGDACLRLVARTLQNEIRNMDVAARLQADEFVILLSNTSREEATPRAQNINWQINHLSLGWYGDQIPLQASIGIKSFKKGDVAEDIFNAADMDLYACKRKESNNQQTSLRGTTT